MTSLKTKLLLQRTDSFLGDTSGELGDLLAMPYRDIIKTKEIIKEDLKRSRGNKHLLPAILAAIVLYPNTAQHTELLDPPSPIHQTDTPTAKLSTASNDTISTLESVISSVQIENTSVTSSNPEKFEPLIPLDSTGVLSRKNILPILFWVTTSEQTQEPQWEIFHEILEKINYLEVVLNFKDPVLAMQIHHQVWKMQDPARRAFIFQGIKESFEEPLNNADFSEDALDSSVITALVDGLAYDADFSKDALDSSVIAALVYGLAYDAEEWSSYDTYENAYLFNVFTSPENIGGLQSYLRSMGMEISLSGVYDTQSQEALRTAIVEHDFRFDQASLQKIDEHSKILAHQADQIIAENTTEPVVSPPLVWEVNRDWGLIPKQIPYIEKELSEIQEYIIGENMLPLLFWTEENLSPKQPVWWKVEEVLSNLWIDPKSVNQESTIKTVHAYVDNSNDSARIAFLQRLAQQVFGKDTVSNAYLDGKKGSFTTALVYMLAAHCSDSFSVVCHDLTYFDLMTSKENITGLQSYLKNFYGYDLAVNGEYDVKTQEALTKAILYKEGDVRALEFDEKTFAEIGHHSRIVAQTQEGIQQQQKSILADIQTEAPLAPSTWSSIPDSTLTASRKVWEAPDLSHREAPSMLGSPEPQDAIEVITAAYTPPAVHTPVVNTQEPQIAHSPVVEVAWDTQEPQVAHSPEVQKVLENNGIHPDVFSPEEISNLQSRVASLIKEPISSSEAAELAISGGEIIDEILEVSSHSQIDVAQLNIDTAQGIMDGVPDFWAKVVGSSGEMLDIAIHNFTKIEDGKLKTLTRPNVDIEAGSTIITSFEYQGEPRYYKYTVASVTNGILELSPMERIV